jgi:hypothetical protein
MFIEIEETQVEASQNIQPVRYKKAYVGIIRDDVDGRELWRGQPQEQHNYAWHDAKAALRTMES